MKKLLVLLLVLAFGLSIWGIGCGTKDTSEADKAPAEVQKAEAMDSTALDSAATEMVDTAAVAAPDSM